MEFGGHHFSFCVMSHIRASLDVVRTGIDFCLNRFGVIAEFDKSIEPLNLGSVYVDRPPAGSVHRIVLVAYAPMASTDSTVVVVNLEDGWSSLIQCVSSRVSGEHLLLQLGSSVMTYPRVAFERFVGGRLERTVAVWKEEDRWQFWNEGQVQNWENTEAYRNRSIKSRLTCDALIAGLKSISIDIESDEFWTANGKAHYWRRKQLRMPERKREY